MRLNDYIEKLKHLKKEHFRLVALIISSSLLAISLVLVVAFTSIFIVSVLRSTFSAIIYFLQFVAEVVTAVVAAITSGLTITCSILASVTTAALTLPPTKIRGRVFVAFVIAGTSTAFYIIAIFIFSTPKMGKELTSAVVFAAASSVAFASAWAVGIMSLVEKETSNFGLKITSVLETVRRNNHRLLRILLRLNICIKQRDLDLGLLYASKIGYIECFEQLLKAGANPDSKDSYENTPLSMACEHGSTRMIKLLLEKGVDLEMKSGGRRGTALHKASNWGYLNCINLLLERGADRNARDLMNRTPLMLACIHAPAAEDIIKKLIEYGSDVNVLSNDSKSALHFACARGLAPNVLLEADADPNARDMEGNTPLHLAASGGHCFVVKKLIKAGASTQYVNYLGRCALHVAAIGGCAKCVSILLPLSQFTRDSSGHNPLWYTAEHGHYDATLVIIRSNTYLPPLKPDESQNMDDPLVAALKGHHLSTARLILSAGFSDRCLGSWLTKLTSVTWFDDDPEDIEWLKRFLFNAKPLLHVCRCKLRNILGPSVFYLSSQIRFPEYLQNYLTLSEFLS